MPDNSFSQLVSVFHEKTAPEQGYLTGYGAILSMAGRLRGKFVFFEEKKIVNHR